MKAITLITTFPVLLCAQDKLTLSTGEVLNGQVDSISKNKIISLKHIASKNGLSIDAAKTKRIDLNTIGKEFGERPDSLVYFRNGDSLGAKVTSIDSDSVFFTSPQIGDHEVDRDQINYITFGNSVYFPVFKQVNTPKLFESNTGWKLKDGKYLAQASVHMWEKFDMGENFILKFDLEWTNSPSIILHFAASSSKPSTRNDRFTLNMSDSSIAFGQHSTDGERPRSFPSKVVNKTLRNYPNDKVKLELWVSRSTGNITLFLDGVKIHKLAATITPTGSFIGLQSASSTSSLIVSNFEVSTWDGQRTAQVLRESVGENFDIMSLTSGDVIGGKLAGSELNEGVLHYNIEKDEAETGSISQPESKLSMLQFAKPNTPIEKNPLKASALHGGSRLSLSDISLQAGKIKASHPILGNITIDRKHFSYLELN